MKLFLVRHGQTDWNLTQRFQGRSDVPLNEVGREQANVLAKRLSNQAFDVVYASDLQRAVETAKNCASKFHSDSRLREISFGDWEGLTYHEIKEKHSDHLEAWENDIYNNAPPNGETLEQFVQRIQSMLNDLINNHKDQTVLIVAHGGVLQVLVCLAQKLSPLMYWQFHISPASLSEISFYPAGAILDLLNDTSYLHSLAT